MSGTHGTTKPDAAFIGLTPRGREARRAPIRPAREDVPSGRQRRVLRRSYNASGIQNRGGRRRACNNAGERVSARAGCGAGGDGGADTVDGGEGDDVVEGGLRPGDAAADTLIGGPGVDAMAGGGDDTIRGGDGDDYRDRVIGGTTTNEVIDPGARLRGGEGDDRVYGGPGRELYVAGDAGDDTLNGGPGGDTLQGGAGEDRLFGGGDRGLDDLSGGPGPDRLSGGAGDDFRLSTGKVRRGGDLVPDGARDFVDCGPGTDTVRYERGVDVVAADCERKTPYRTP